MSAQDQDEDDKPPTQVWDLAVIAVAALLTLCGVGVCFFKFTIAAAPPAKPAAQPAEVTIGIGQGSTINPSKPGPVH
jgi:hypothetical protein